jgi:hypothetical protein
MEEEKMNIITLTEHAVDIEITGWDKLWAFKRSLTIPKDSISKAYRYDGNLKPPFWRSPGTEIPGVIIAGTYQGQGQKEFWNTRFKSTIVFDLKNGDYTRVVVDVEDPNQVLAELKNGLA